MASERAVAAPDLSSLFPNLEHGTAMRSANGKKLLGRRNRHASTGDIVNQNENDRPNIQGATVSYQTMSNFSVPIWEILNQSRSGCGRVPQVGEIFFDNATEVAELGCFRTKGKSANGNGLYQTA
jgi:hypothetical protein